MSDSPFLRIPRSDWVAHNALAFAVRDKHPVTPGHTLVVLKREVATWFDATLEEHVRMHHGLARGFADVVAVGRECRAPPPRAGRA